MIVAREKRFSSKHRPYKIFQTRVLGLDISDPIPAENSDASYYEIKVHLDNERWPIEFRGYANKNGGGSVWKLVELFETCDATPVDNGQASAYTDVNGIIYPDVIGDCIGKELFILKYAYKEGETGPYYLAYNRFGKTKDEVKKRFLRDAEDGYVPLFDPSLCDIDYDNKEEDDYDTDELDNPDTPF